MLVLFMYKFYIMEVIMKKNRILIICIVLAMSIFVISACSNSKDSAAIAGTEKISVVCTIFPQYDWVREIIGENTDDYEITLLMDDGIDLHSYQPSAKDIATISNCDLFIYVGGESDKWVDDVLKETVNKEMKVISLLEVLGDAVKKEEIIEGMEHEHHEHDEDEDHEHDEDEDHEHEEDEHDEDEHHEHDEDESHFHEDDEHVWLSLKNAQVIINSIKNALEEIDSKNSEIYAKNYNNYVEKLSELDMEYQAAVNSSKRKTILFADRFPFRYMVDDYGLSYHAAFAGCSAETEASFETIAFLSGKTEELKLSSVLVIENSDNKLANTIIENTASKNQEILVMDSLQSVTNKKLKDGYSYLSVMKNNLEILKKALN